jgi:hypothetical protein
MCCYGLSLGVHIQGRKFRERGIGVSRWLQTHAGSSFADFSTLKMEAIRSPETSVHTRSTPRHIPEDGIFTHLLVSKYCIIIIKN